MKKTAFLKRKCEKCPPWTQTVCRHAFGKFWNDRSNCGEGCDNPLDDVAESWRKAGWTPDKGETLGLVLPTRPTVHNAQLPRRPTVPMAQLPRRPTVPMAQLKAPSRVPMAQVKAPSPVHYAHVAKANSRVNNLQLKMPVRPKVSAKITKQAELFFRGLK